MKIKDYHAQSIILQVLKTFELFISLLLLSLLVIHKDDKIISIGLGNQC